MRLMAKITNDLVILELDYNLVVAVDPARRAVDQSWRNAVGRPILAT